MRRAICLSAAVMIGLWTNAGNECTAQNDARYRMEGTVTDEAGQPVAGVTVNVLVNSEPEPSQRLRKATTDAAGRYSIQVPIGHAAAFGLQAPPGYCEAKSSGIEPFATTAEQPVFKKDFQVRKGVAWPVSVRIAAGELPEVKKYVSGGLVRDQEYFGAYIELDRLGHGVLTLPDVGGTFELRCAAEDHSLESPKEMKLTADKGFRSDRVANLQALEAGGFELRDADGRTASVAGAECQIKDGVASLTIPAKPIRAADLGTIVGRIVDHSDKPIAGAKIEAALHEGGGSAATGIATKSDENGNFRLRIAQQSAGVKTSLVVTADGYGGLDTDERPFDFQKSKEISVDSIKLAKGSSIRLRVVDSSGKPLVGAVVEPGGNYASRTQITRTDNDGYCTLKNLAAGMQSFYASFGGMYVQSKMPLKEGENDLLVIKLRKPPAAAVAAAPDGVKKKLVKGDAAPAWDIAEWTDGQARKLADFRGKVVVLDFWGVWCGPCVRAIPAMKQLHERFAERGVVFLAIHTAGTDMTLVKRLIEQQDWKTVTGLDRGDDIITGATVKAYAVEGFPTVMIIDRQGKIAYSDHDLPDDRDAVMKRMEQLAKSLDIPWPLDKDANDKEKDATEKEIIDRMTRLQIGMFSREIEQALAK